MKVLKDYVLVEEPTVEEKKSEGGIILAQDKVDYTTPITNVVVSVGKDVEEVKEGDTILYLARSGTELKHDGKNYRILKEEEIVAII